MDSLASLAWQSIGAVIGAVLGVAVSVWGRWSAQAAVSVRPRLAEVGFIDAFLADHAHDWLFYHHPEAMSIVVVAFLVTVSSVAWTSSGRQI